MIKKRLLRGLGAALLVGMLTIGSCITAFAADDYTGSVTCDVGDGGKLYTLLDTIQKAAVASGATSVETELAENAYNYFVGYQETQAEDGTKDPTIQITWGGATRSFFNNNTKTSANSDTDYITMYNGIKQLSDAAGLEAGTTTANINDVNSSIDEIAQLNTQANVSGGVDILEPLLPTIQLVMGAIVTLAVWLLGVITAIDILYMIIPPFHSMLDSVGEGGGKASGQTKSGEIKCRFVSDDAVDAYKKYEEGNGNPLIIYVKSRIITYIAAALVIYLLLSGNMGLIISIVLNLLSGLINTVAEALPT